MYKLLTKGNLGSKQSAAIKDKNENAGFAPTHSRRFPDYQSLKNAADAIFTEEYLEKTGALERFKEIDGELYVIPYPGSDSDDFGEIIVAGWEETEEKMTFSTVIEKYKDGELSGYYPMPDFTLEKVEDNWKVSSLSYPE